MRGGFFRKRTQKDGFSLNAELILKAWQLSMILLDGASAQAENVVLEAINMADTYHPKRGYYELGSRKHRNKVIFDKPMLLQYFVYEAARKYELEQEQEYLKGKRFLPEQTMWARYIKHLLFLSTENRSFSVTVGLCRLLYDYKQCQTSKIYEALTQYGGPDKSDEQYRGCKLKLMAKLIERFPDFLIVYERAKQEKRFLLYENQSQVTNYVKQCLTLFSPWKSSCILPTVIVGPQPLIPPLSFLGANPDDEHPIEKARIHTVIHPACFSRLIEAVGCPSIEERLAMPDFSISTSNTTPQIPTHPPVDLDNLPVPTREEWNNLTDRLLQQRYRRQHAWPRELIVAVDGIPCERIALEKTASARIELRETDDLIQVFSKEKEGDILLSTSSLRFNRILGDDECGESCLRLESGQEISITVLTRKTGDTAGPHTPSIEIAYRETNWIRAFFFLLRKLRYEMSQMPVKGANRYGQVLARMRCLDGKKSAILIPASSLFLTLALLILGAIGYSQERLKREFLEAESERLKQTITEKLQVEQLLNEGTVEIVKLKQENLKLEQQLKKAEWIIAEKGTEIGQLKGDKSRLVQRTEEAQGEITGQVFVIKQLKAERAMLAQDLQDRKDMERGRSRGEYRRSGDPSPGSGKK
jgi:hypothetical protein